MEKNKYEKKYVSPANEVIEGELDKFKDLKLGFMTHFGMFNQGSMIESWMLSDEVERNRWSQWGIDWLDIESVKKQYWNLNKSFNPVRFDPDRWASFVARNGFKYAILPTKHHDGFCMWDTKYTDYKTTNNDCPYSVNKNADVFGALVKSFQNQSIKTGAYFSSADWHHEDFWPKQYKESGNTKKFAGYDVLKEKEKWQRFCKFTSNQMIEVATKYDNIDIMWIDGGWHRKDIGEDLKIEETMDKARIENETIIFVERHNPGRAENYVTPEQTIPEMYVDVPWEACISLPGGFSYSYEQEHKDPYHVASIFIEILCKGGNLLLNISPQPDGRLPYKAMYQIEQFGKWVAENEKAIFNTRPIAPYWQNNCGLVENKEGTKYLFVKTVKEELIIHKYVYVNIDYDFTQIKYKGEEVVFKDMGNRIRITMPEKYIDSILPLGLVFEVK